MGFEFRVFSLFCGFYYLFTCSMSKWVLSSNFEAVLISAHIHIHTICVYYIIIDCVFKLRLLNSTKTLYYAYYHKQKCYVKSQKKKHFLHARNILFCFHRFKFMTHLFCLRRRLWQYFRNSNKTKRKIVT